MAKVYVSVNHGSSLLKELNQQFKEGKNCDLEIRLNCKRLYVHKCLIDIFFMKVGAEIEDDRFYLDLTKYSQSVVESLVCFIYTGSLMCPIDKQQSKKGVKTTHRVQVEKVYLAAAELGCVDAQKGCQLYLQNAGFLPVRSSNDSVSYLEKRKSDLVTSTSNSETESLDATDEPPKVKIEVVDDTYEYQSTDSSNFASESAENLDTVPKILDYSSTSSLPPVCSTDSYSTGNDQPLSFSSILDTIQAATNVQPKTIAVPVGMHSTPEDFKEVQKRTGRTTIVNELEDIAVTTSYPTMYPTIGTSKKRKAEPIHITVPQAPVQKPGRRCTNQGPTVEIVYPKKPIIDAGKHHRVSHSKNDASMLNEPYVKGSVMKAGKPETSSKVKEGLRVKLKPRTAVTRATHASTSTNTSTSKPATSMMKRVKQVEKYTGTVDSPISSYSGDSYKVKESTPVSNSSNSDNDSNFKEIIVKTEPVDVDDETEQDRDLESEKNEQMLFLGLTKTIDEDKRRLEEQSAPKMNTRRLRTRKKVDYSKANSVDFDDELDELELPVSTKAKKQKTTTSSTSTAVGGSDNVYTKDSKRAYASTVAVKTGLGSTYVNEMYFPAAGTVPDGTRSRYAQGSYMRAKFVTESIEDKDGNVTVVSKRVPVRPRQFGIDERLKNRPAVYICHPTAPVINTNTRAPTKQ